MMAVEIILGHVFYMNMYMRTDSNLLAPIIRQCITDGDFLGRPHAKCLAHTLDVDIWLTSPNTGSTTFNEHQTGRLLGKTPGRLRPMLIT